MVQPRVLHQVATCHPGDSSPSLLHLDLCCSLPWLHLLGVQLPVLAVSGLTGADGGGRAGPDEWCCWDAGHMDQAGYWAA